MAVTASRRYSPRLPREERREQVLDAALRLLSGQGFGGLSMEGVAREADIAKTVVYDLFPNREELLAALLEREQERALADVGAAVPSPPIEGDPLDALIESLSTVLDAVHRRSDSWRLILLPADGTPPAVRAAVDDHRRRLRDQIEPMVAWGLGRLQLSHLDAELTADTILAFIENALRLTLTQPRRYPTERLVTFARDLSAPLVSDRRTA
jgi:AcrR family transcriptional regulator